MSKKRSILFSLFFLINIVLLIFSCYGGYINWWPMELLVLGSFYLLILVLYLLLIALLSKKKLLALAGIVAILICYTPIKNIWRPFSTNKEVVKKDSSQLRIMSWNVDKMDVLADNVNSPIKLQMLEKIKAYQPDIACFVEFVASKTEKDRVNFLPDMLKTMGMENYHHYFDDDEYYYKNQQFGKIIISKYPIINAHVVSFGPRTYNHRFTYADVVKDKDTFRVFVVHFQSLKMEESERIVSTNIDANKNILRKIRNGFLQRAEQAGVVKSYIDKSPYRVIVCGDFNDVPNSFAYNTIGKNLNNAFAEKGAGLGKTFPGIVPTLRIDNIFVSRNFSVERFYTPNLSLSDHYPIIADVSIQ